MNLALALQLASSTLMNVGFALLVGLWLTRQWLERAHAAWLLACVPLLRRAEMAAIVACLVGLVSSVWAGAATMSGLPPIQALPDCPMILTTTVIGHAALAGVVLIAMLLLFPVDRPRGVAAQVSYGVLLLAFAVDRASVSHAADMGFVSVDVLVEVIHLAMIAIWVGGVLVGGWLVLPQSSALQFLPAAPRALYLDRLSSVSTLALAGLFATGLYNTWQRVGSPDKFLGNPYGTVLLLKLAAVTLALGLGGYNRFVGFPALARSAEPGASHAIPVLRVESVLLLLALFAAVLLTTLEPPVNL